jgi:hypothetical protein
MSVRRKIMKKILTIGLVAGLTFVGGLAHASVEYFQTFGGGSVMAGNPVPTVFTGTFNMDPNSLDPVLAITVGLSISGGYSGSFNMSLIGPDGNTTTILLDNPGTATSGLNVTLQDGAIAIASSSDLSSGTYAAYGSLSGLNGQLADGTWTLIFADTASGVDPTLNSWTLNIEVPEPVNVALGVFGSLFAVVIVARRRAKKLAAKRPVRG